MADHERIIHQLVHSLSEVVNNNINASAITECLKETVSSIDYSEQQSFLLNTFFLTSTLSQQTVKCMNTLADQRVSQMTDSIVRLTTQQTAVPQQETSTPKQMVFNTTEVMKILNIKKRDTAIKYFKNGTIKATQIDNSNRWIVQRQDLADYLHSDNF